MGGRRRVAVFDIGLPAGLAFVRSLGRAGVPVDMYSDDPGAMARYSKHAGRFHQCPSVHHTDEFVSWLASELERGSIDLVAPTSDYVAFNASRAGIRVGADIDTGQPLAGPLLDCLFKDRFAAALTAADFPTPRTAAPTSVDEAIAFAEVCGYPVVMKPRSHVAVGVARGMVLRTAADVEHVYGPYQVSAAHSLALEQDPDLCWPLLQHYLDPRHVNVISVTGCLDRDSRLTALGHSRKTHQWPPRLGVGTSFDALGPQPFTDRAVAAVQKVLGSGIFELEVLHDLRTDEFWAIDLNPRGFGQMALDIGRGNDLPALWYSSVTGEQLARPRARRRPPRRWRMGIQYYIEMTIRSARGPRRAAAIAELGRGVFTPHVGAVLDWRDSRPALRWTRLTFQHPGGLVRPYLSDTEIG